MASTIHNCLNPQGREEGLRAAAEAVLGVVDEAFLAEVRRKGDAFARRLAGIDGVAEVRGRGLMLAAVLTTPVAKQAVSAALEHGLIINAPGDRVLRFTPPLVITDAELDQAAERLAATLAQVINGNA